MRDNADGTRGRYTGVDSPLVPTGICACTAPPGVTRPSANGQPANLSSAKVPEGLSSGAVPFVLVMERIEMSVVFILKSIKRDTVQDVVVSSHSNDEVFAEFGPIREMT